MKDIKGYEGLYAVTECGKVWSYRSKKFLTPYNVVGYHYVDLRNKGVRKQFRVHRLVAEAYIPNPENKPQINHKDENKINNHVSNLEWVTAKENVNYGTHNERMAKTRSKAVYCVELDRVFESQKEAAAELGLYSGNISSCCNGRTKTCGGLHWRFATQDDINAHNLRKSLDELARAVKIDLALDRIGLESAC